MSGGLFVLDFDNHEIFNYIVDDVEEVARHTTVAKTAKGFHIYYRAPTDGTPGNKKFGGGKVGLDLKGEKGYVVAPPSIHPSGAQYTFLDGVKEPKLIEKVDDLMEWLVRKAEEWPFVSGMIPNWTEGRRNDLALGLSGFFRKHLQWPEERVREIIGGICRITKDEEPDMRLKAVASTFQRELDDIAVQEWLGEDLMVELASRLPQRDRLGTEGRVYNVNDGALVHAYYYMNPGKPIRYAIEKYRASDDAWVVQDDWRVFTDDLKLNALIDAGEEDPLLEIQVGDDVLRANRDDLLKWLDAHGKIATPRFRKEALTALQEISRTMGLPFETKAPWAGVYLTSPQMTVMWDPVPIKSEQQFTTGEIQQRTEGVDELGAGLQAFRDLIDYFEPDEIYPILGAGISGPFWHLLKQKRMMDFIFWPVAVGPHGIGKSRVTEAFSHYLFGTPSGHASDMQSPFRLAAHMDSCALPRVYGEAEHFSFDKLSDLIKQGTEFTRITQRGTGSQKMKRYAAVLAPIFNCNNYSISDPNLKPRLLIVPFHGEKATERSKKEKRRSFSQVYGDLRAVGKLVLERLVESLNQEDGVNTLRARIEVIRMQLEDMEVHTTDHRRLYAWAVYIWGVIAFDELCEKELQRPFLPKDDPMGYLVKEVVLPLEGYNREEAVEDVFSAFLGWFEVWIDRNTQRNMTTGETFRRGEDRTWKEDNDYYYVTKGIFGEFRRENRHYEVRSMRALAQEIAGPLDISLGSIYKSVRYSGDKNRPKKSILLPKKEQTTLAGFSGSKEEPPDEPDIFPTEAPSKEELEKWVERAMQIMRTDRRKPFKFVVRDLQKEFEIKNYQLAQKAAFTARDRIEKGEKNEGGTED